MQHSNGIHFAENDVLVVSGTAYKHLQHDRGHCYLKIGIGDVIEDVVLHGLTPEKIIDLGATIEREGRRLLAERDEAERVKVDVSLDASIERLASRKRLDAEQESLTKSGVPY